MKRKATTWLAQIVAVLLMLAAGSASASVSGETCRACGEFCSFDAAELFVAPLTRGQRLTEYFNRLRGQPPSRTANEALGRVNQTLTEVEDTLSGIPKQNPPPPPNMPDGRMYPALEDSIVRNPNGSITARTRGHDISIGADGSITITNRQTGQIDFHQAGGGQ